MAPRGGPPERVKAFFLDEGYLHARVDEQHLADRTIIVERTVTASSSAAGAAPRACRPSRSGRRRRGESATVAAALEACWPGNGWRDSLSRRHRRLPGLLTCDWS